MTRSKHLKSLVDLVEGGIKRLEKLVPPGWHWREELGWENAYAEQLQTKLKLPAPK